ncbi:hypothetical protein RhiirC2_786828 [Rhizophagus irregularis]|uniref:Uncharacterized protein n=1 Tax=Rhizophagus irregularis TaxID=588596 RepID=A0A2N1MTK5_9GLOM|nr:hypothetical protein RhiirC2_786828 [Rhizophagus irregularis]
MSYKDEWILNLPPGDSDASQMLQTLLNWKDLDLLWTVKPHLELSTRKLNHLLWMSPSQRNLYERFQISNDKNILTEKEFTLNIEPNDNLSLNIEPMLNIERLSVTTNKQKRCNICIHFRANHQRSESAIKAEQAAKEVLIICERNQTTLVEINEQVLRKTSQDSWWQVVITNYSIRM